MENKFNSYSEEGNALIQGWIREFDELCKKQDRFNSSPRFVEFEGEKMNIEKFLEYKLKQTG